jgi:probable F420-dependent oxidoreductase
VGLAYFIHKADSGTLDRAVLAEELGYDTVFVTQLAGRDAFVMLTAYAARTERIRVGTGITPIYSRTPVTTAQSAATLDEVSDGRFTLGLGVSQRLIAEAWHGQTIESPVDEMREYLAIVRAILRGEPPPPGRKWQSHFQLAGMDPRPDIPIYLAALAPGMLRLAGEVADGAILWLCHPRYVEEVAIPAILEGRAKAGKGIEGFDLAAGLLVAVTDDREAALADMRRRLRAYFTAPFYRDMIQRAGFGDELEAFDAAGTDVHGQRAALSDRFLKGVTLAGDEAEVGESLRRFRESGIDTPCIGPVGPTDDDLDATLRAVASLDRAATADVTSAA